MRWNTIPGNLQVIASWQRGVVESRALFRRASRKWRIWWMETSWSSTRSAVLYSGWNKPMYQEFPDSELWMPERGSLLRKTWVLHWMPNWMRQQCGVIANKADFIVGYIRRMVGNRIGKVIIPLLSMVMKLCLEFYVLFVSLSVHLLFPPLPVLRKCKGSDGGLLKWLRDWEDVICKEEELGLFILVRRRLMGNWLATYNHLKGDWKWWHQNFSSGKCHKNKYGGLKVTQEVQIRYWRNFLLTPTALYCSTGKSYWRGCGTSVLEGFQYSDKQSHSWHQLVVSLALCGISDQMTSRDPFFQLMLL